MKLKVLCIKDDVAVSEEFTTSLLNDYQAVAASLKKLYDGIEGVEVVGVVVVREVDSEIY